MKSIGWLAILPILAMLLGPVLHNASRPFIMGMPFILGWIVVWVIITSGVMAVIYRLDPARLTADAEDGR